MAMCGGCYCCGCCLQRRSLSRPRARTNSRWDGHPVSYFASSIAPRLGLLIRIHVKWLAAHDSLRALKVRRPAVSRRLADGNRKSAAGGRWRPMCYMVNSGPRRQPSRRPTNGDDSNSKNIDDGVSTR
jgi:hypothetical protein